MRVVALCFLIGFITSYIPSVYVYSKMPITGGDVYAMDESFDLEIVMENAPDPTLVPTPTMAPKPTNSPKPTSSSVPTITQEQTTTPVPTTTPEPAPTPTPDVWSPANMDGWFSQYAGQYGVDKNILERIANCESHFNPEAISGDYAGMFQFSTTTWANYRAKMGLTDDPSLRTNPEEAIKTAAFILQQTGTAPWPSCLR